MAEKTARYHELPSVVNEQLCEFRFRGKHGAVHVCVLVFVTLSGPVVLSETKARS